MDAVLIANEYVDSRIKQRIPELNKGFQGLCAS